jgi:hypothetical protein
MEKFIHIFKRRTLLIFFSLFVCNHTFGQDQVKYAELIEEAWSLFKGKEYRKSVEKYAEAFIVVAGKERVNDRYNAACAWALANEPDSAFVQLFKIAENGNYTNIEHITTDTDLNSLHNDARWIKVIEIVRNNEAKLDKVLIAMLDTIYQEDQKYRQKLSDIEKQYGWKSDEIQNQWKIINEKDSINLIKIKKILDEQGWLGADIIGKQGNLTLFLVIQHSDNETREKYLPMIREAAKNGNIHPYNLAMLEDRVALGKGEKQIYGTQVMYYYETGEYFVLPLMDIDNVDKRRAEIGLGTMQDYLFSNWGINWNVEEYKKKLLEYETKKNKQNENEKH